MVEVDPHQRVDALLPAEMAVKAETVGAAKARADTLSLLALAVLAGADIAFGAIFFTTTVTGGGDLPYGLVRLLGGLAFTVGLILVVVGGAELFTGNNLMVMAWAGRKITSAALLRAWVLVYLGNLVGAVGTAAMVVLAGHHGFAGGEMGRTALAIAQAKSQLGFIEALFLGVLCNVLVCLAVWLTYSAQTVTGKILAVVPPIAAFAAAGFEHSVANMYFLAVGLGVKHLAGPEFWAAIAAAPADYSAVTVLGAAANLVPVTIGNVIGGGILVGAVYWFIYLRHR